MEIKNAIFDISHICFDNPDDFEIRKDLKKISIPIVGGSNCKSYYLVKKGEEYDSNTKYAFINYIEKSFSLCHPSIINITKFSLEKPYLYYEISEEYVSIDNINLTYENIQKILIGVASGLSYLISQGYYYQNFSKSSILLDKNCYPKLIDYIDYDCGESDKKSEKSLLYKYVDVMNFLIEKKRKVDDDRSNHKPINENLQLLINLCKQETKSPTLNDFVTFFITKPLSSDSSFIQSDHYQEYLDILHLSYGSSQDIVFDSIDKIYNYFEECRSMKTLSDDDLFLLNLLTENHIKQLTPVLNQLKNKLIRYLYNEDISLIIRNWTELCDKYSEKPFALYKKLMSKIEQLEKEKNENFYNYKLKEDLLFQIDALRIQAIHFLKKASEQKNIDAQIELAVQYVKNYILPSNLAKAKDILKSITGADKSTQKLINEIIEKIETKINDTSIENITNIPESQRNFFENARKGKIISMLYAGFAFYTGFNGFPINQPLSINLYKQAAKKSPDAMAILGYLYFNGIIFPHNLRKARKCFESAANSGCVKAEIIDCIIRKHVWRSYLIEFDINNLFNYVHSMDTNDAFQFPIIIYNLENNKNGKSLFKLQLLKEEEKYNSNCGKFLFAKKINVNVEIKNIEQQYSEKDLIKSNVKYDEMKLAKSYYYGQNDFPVNYSKAASYFKKAAKKGNSEAQWRYAMLCFNSLGADFKDTEYYFRKSASQNDIKGKLYYSLYLKHKKDSSDSNLFGTFLKDCCDAGDPDAMYYYAMFLENNQDNNINNSIKYYKEAVKKGNLDSLIRLNYIYKAFAHVKIQKYFELSVGMINEKFLVKLIHWYDNNNKEEYSSILIQFGILLNQQLFNLYHAYHLMYGRGVKQDIEKALMLANFAFNYNYQPKYQQKYIYLKLQIFLKKKEHGNALKFLLQHKEQLNEKYSKYFHEFYKKFNKNLARKNLIPACFCCKDYRMKYDLILEGSKKYASFTELQDCAQNDDNPFLMAIVGKVYKKGKIVIRNLEKAIQYFARSAELECPLGYYYIGKEYYYGRYLEQNYTKATRFLLLAIKGNAEPRAGFYLYKISKFRPDLEIDGIERLKIGALFGHKKALFKYGLFLYQGNRIQKNEHEAIKLIRQASFQDYQKAKNFCILHRISMKKNRSKKQKDSTKKQINLNKIAFEKYHFSESIDENDDSYSSSYELSINENDSETSYHKKDKKSSNVNNNKKILNFDNEPALNIDFEKYKVSSSDFSIHISDDSENDNDS